MDLTKKFKNMDAHLRYYLSYHINYPLAYPKEINFQMTNRCTLRCKMCNIWKNHKNKREIDVDEIKRILDEVKSWNTKYVSFVGGESLVRMEDTFELIEYAHSLGFNTNIVSNATLLTEEVCNRLVESGLNRIALSLDGATSKTHDSIRGKGSYKKVLRSAKTFLKLKEKHNIKLDFATVVMSYNYKELGDIYKLAKKIGVNQWFLQSVVLDNTFHNFDYNSDVWIKESELEELKKEINRLISLKYKDPEFIYNSADYLKNIPLYFELKGEFNLGKCMAGYFSLNIDPYGTISICNYGPNINVIGKSLEEAWKSKKFKETRALIKDCKMPCMMLCYQRFSIPELLRMFFKGY